MSLIIIFQMGELTPSRLYSEQLRTRWLLASSIAFFTIFLKEFGSETHFPTVKALTHSRGSFIIMVCVAQTIGLAMSFLWSTSISGFFFNNLVKSNPKRYALYICPSGRIRLSWSLMEVKCLIIRIASSFSFTDSCLRFCLSLDWLNSFLAHPKKV